MGLLNMEMPYCTSCDNMSQFNTATHTGQFNMTEVLVHMKNVITFLSLFCIVVFLFFQIYFLNLFINSKCIMNTK